MGVLVAPLGGWWDWELGYRWGGLALTVVHWHHRGP